jgi:hypothetical protein
MPATSSLVERTLSAAICFRLRLTACVHACRGMRATQSSSAQVRTRLVVTVCILRFSQVSPFLSCLLIQSRYTSIHFDCAIEIDACVNAPCGINATCTDLRPPFSNRTCTCPPGFDGDAFKLCKGNTHLMVGFDDSHQHMHLWLSLLSGA